ncbi:hypothetical protein E2C01_052519 [Portunus trituberculatus]|uniref:Uncharacterized protein n=1 Tax=Portunus trituberculatus TaxID=210409 RepID=A0A5B7GM08_PORTR|nr:hypothetical protein [Portunus trituberculatus]
MAGVWGRGTPAPPPAAPRPDGVHARSCVMGGLWWVMSGWSGSPVGYRGRRCQFRQAEVGVRRPGGAAGSCGREIGVPLGVCDWRDPVEAAWAWDGRRGVGGVSPTRAAGRLAGPAPGRVAPPTARPALRGAPPPHGCPARANGRRGRLRLKIEFQKLVPDFIPPNFRDLITELVNKIGT